MIPIIIFFSHLIHRWLQPESYLDYKQTELVYSRDELKCNWPATLLLQTKDQYGKLVNVPNLKVIKLSNECIKIRWKNEKQIQALVFENVYYPPWNGGILG